MNYDSDDDAIVYMVIIGFVVLLLAFMLFALVIEIAGISLNFPSAEPIDAVSGPHPNTELIAITKQAFLLHDGC